MEVLNIIKLKDIPNNIQTPERKVINNYVDTIGDTRKGNHEQWTNEQYLKGEGFKPKEIAGILGIVYQTTSNPNQKVIIKAIEKLRIKPSGTINSTRTHYNNGGAGTVFFEVHLYSIQNISDIKKEIEKYSKIVSNDIFRYIDIKFRIDD